MKRLSMFLALVMLASALPGCSEHTRNSMKSDINEGARDADRAVKDAVD
jgi:hypothetical protein